MSFWIHEAWDKAPPEWYFVYVICAYLGILVVYIFWKKCGGYHRPEDDQK